MAGRTAFHRRPLGFTFYEWYERELVGYPIGGGSAMVLWSLPVVLSACRSYVAKELMNPSSCVLVLCSEWRPDGSVLRGVLWSSDGQPIIMSHGWGPNSAVWYYAKRQLSDRFRVIVWDLPGLGKSSKPKTRITRRKICARPRSSCCYSGRQACYPARTQHGWHDRTNILSAVLRAANAWLG